MIAGTRKPVVRVALATCLVAVMAVTASPAEAGNTKVLAYVGNNGTGTVAVVDNATKTVVHTISLTKGPNFGGMTDLAASPNGSRVYIGVAQAEPFSGRLYTIDTSSNAVVAALVIPLRPAGLAISPTGNRLYVTEASGDAVAVVDPKKNKIVATVAVGDHPLAAAVTPDGAHVYVANGEYDNPYPDPYPGPGTVSVIATATNTVVATIQTPPHAQGVAVSPDGTRAYVTSSGDANYSDDGTVTVIDTATNTTLATVGLLGDNASGVAVSPDGKRVYAPTTGPSSYDGHSVGTLHVIDTATNTVDDSLAAAVGRRPLRVALTPDGGRAYVSNFDTMVDPTNQLTIVDTTAGPDGAMTVAARLSTDSPDALPYGVTVFACRRCG
ncbi:MAG TPA: YncE family protein [Acidimicrobiales bacterium]|jgi:YVTN family beta-propeller protein